MTSDGFGCVAKYPVSACAVLTAPMPVTTNGKRDEPSSVASSSVAASSSTWNHV